MSPGGGRAERSRWRGGPGPSWQSGRGHGQGQWAPTFCGGPRDLKGSGGSSQDPAGLGETARPRVHVCAAYPPSLPANSPLPHSGLARGAWCLAGNGQACPRASPGPAHPASHTGTPSWTVGLIPPAAWFCRSWLGCEGQPGWYSPCAPGWPLPCRSHPLLRQAPLPASPAPSPLLGGWLGGLPRSQAAQMKEGSRGPQLGPPISRDGLGPCGASASPGVERHRTSAGREWTWSPGAAQGPQAPQQPPCFRGCGPSRHRLPPPACSPPSLTAPGEPPHCPLGSGHQIGSGPPWACGAAGLEAAQGSGRGPGGWGLPERTAGCTFGLAPAGACRGCGSGQVLAASQLREDGGGVEVNIRVC